LRKLLGDRGIEAIALLARERERERERELPSLKILKAWDFVLVCKKNIIRREALVDYFVPCEPNLIQSNGSKKLEMVRFFQRNINERGTNNNFDPLHNVQIAEMKNIQRPE